MNSSSPDIALILKKIQRQMAQPQYRHQHEQLRLKCITLQNAIDIARHHQDE